MGGNRITSKSTTLMTNANGTDPINTSLREMSGLARVESPRHDCLLATMKRFKVTLAGDANG